MNNKNIIISGGNNIMTTSKRNRIIKVGDHCELIINHLGQDYYFKFDKEDKPKVEQYLSSWTVIKTHKSSSYYYAGFTDELENGKRAFFYLHRHLAGIKPRENKVVKCTAGTYDLRKKNLKIINKEAPRSFTGVEKVYDDNGKVLYFRAYFVNDKGRIDAARAFFVNDKMSETEAELAARLFVLLAEVEYGKFSKSEHKDLHFAVLDYNDEIK
jgi:hypothetical protein